MVKKLKGDIRETLKDKQSKTVEAKKYYIYEGVKLLNGQSKYNKIKGEIRVLELILTKLNERIGVK